MKVSLDKTLVTVEDAQAVREAMKAFKEEWVKDEYLLSHFFGNVGFDINGFEVLKCDVKAYKAGVMETGTFGFNVKATVETIDSFIKVDFIIDDTGLIHTEAYDVVTHREMLIYTIRVFKET